MLKCVKMIAILKNAKKVTTKNVHIIQRNGE